MRYVSFPTKYFKEKELSDPDAYAGNFSVIASEILLPVEDLIGAVIRPACFIDDEADCFEIGLLSGTSLCMENGDTVYTTLPIEEVIQKFKDLDLISKIC